MTQTAQITDSTLAATRHLVLRELLDMLPIASYDQAGMCIANLRLCRETSDPAKRQRVLNAALMKFLNLRVTPDIGEAAAFRGYSWKEIEIHFNHRYGERLSRVPGFYQRNPDAPFRLNLPFNCAMYGYWHPLGRWCSGILCQPLDTLNRYFLLSSAKFGGLKAVRLAPRDQQYFEQYREV